MEQSHSYEEFFDHPGANVIGALGLYQMTDAGLIDIGMLKKVENGPPEWTGKDGIESIKEFLANPYVQEIEFAEYVENVRGYLKDNGAMGAVGETIDGFVAPIKITEPGLIAAAHRWGAETTQQYLNALRRNNWNSEAAVIGSPFETRFRTIEYRLRLFQDVSLISGDSSDTSSTVPSR